MSNYDFSFIQDPALRQKLAQRLQGKKEDDGVLSVEDVNEVVSELSAEEGEDAAAPLKLNMNAVLTAIEKGYYLEGSSSGSLSACNEDFVIRGASVAMSKQLEKLGIIELDSEGNVVLNSFNKELAKEIFGTELNSYSDLINKADGSGKFWDISYSFDELDGIPSIVLDKYFVGPALLAETEEDSQYNNFKFYYALNLSAVKQDYPNVNDLEGLKKALASDYKNTHSINGKIDEWVGQGLTGDCWFLSGIISLAKTEAGAKAIQQAIQPVEENGVIVAYDIEFKGAYGQDGKTVKIRVSVKSRILILIIMMATVSHAVIMICCFWNWL